MYIKSLIAAAAVTAFAGTAIAQTTGAVPTEPSWTAEEQAMYEERRHLFEGFFTDDTFAELRGPEEFETAWAGMAPEDQDELRVSCVEVQTSPANYSQNLQDICGQVERY